MSRAKLLFAACFAVFAVSAMAVATASAAEPGWMVGGTNITSPATILPEVKVLEHGLLAVPLAGVIIKCEGGSTINGGKLVPANGVEATSVTFEECSIAEGNCSLATKTIGTVPVDGEATLEGALNTIILVLAKTKNTFATIKFEGASCAILGVQPVTGHAHILIHEGFDERTLHLVLVLSNSLKVGSDEASLHKIDADIRLSNGLPWSFL